MIEHETINGVDAIALDTARVASLEDPSTAKCTYQVRNRWVSGAHNRSVIREFYVAGKLDESRNRSFVLHNDATRSLLGADTGANPLEYLLHALAGCLTTTLIYHAALRGVRIGSVESTIHGTQDARGILGVSNNVRNGFSDVRIELKVTGDASDDTLRELILLAQKRSPVYDLLSNPTGIVVTGSVNRSKQAA